jgi:hypothetical protein
VLLFPQLEQCIRRVYAIANNCPETVLSAGTWTRSKCVVISRRSSWTTSPYLASSSVPCVCAPIESDVLYTTLDILLATSVGEKENRNLIYDELGDNNTNLLLDTFIWAGNRSISSSFS